MDLSSLVSGYWVILRLSMPPRSWILCGCCHRLHWRGAFCLEDVLLNLRSTQHKQQLRVAIYGAGEAGAQLAASLHLAGNHRIVTFLDDNPGYWGRSINGVPISPPQVVMEMESAIDQVLLAIPSSSQRTPPHRRQFPEAWHPYVAGAVGWWSHLRSRPYRCPETDRDRRLIGRDEVLPDPKLLGPGIRGWWYASLVLVARLVRALPPDLELSRLVWSCWS